MKAAKAVVSAVKVMITATKSIVAAIIAGGWGAAVVILVICLVAAIAGSVYAVKLNLDTENPTELATFDEEKADALRQIF